MDNKKIKKIMPHIIGILIIAGVSAMGFLLIYELDKSQQEIYDVGFERGLKACEFYNSLKQNE